MTTVMTSCITCSVTRVPRMWGIPSQYITPNWNGTHKSNDELTKPCSLGDHQDHDHITSSGTMPPGQFTGFNNICRQV